MSGLSLTLTTAVVDDLKDVTVGNGFRRTLARVDRGIAIEIRKAMTPHVGVLLGGFGGNGIDASPTEMTSTIELSTHRVGLRVIVRGDDPDGELHEVLDDVRNAIERGDSHVHQVAGVIDATVVSAQPFHTSEDLASGFAAAEAVVEIRHEYERGNL